MQQPDRTSPPRFFAPQSVTMPTCNVSRSAQGIPLHTLRSGEIEVTRLSLVFHCGSLFQQKPFAASATLSMMSEGTRNYTAAALSERLDFYGLNYEVNIDRDYAMITLCSLSKFFGEGLALLEEILLHPTFPEKELEVYKNRRKQRLNVERSKVAFVAREEFGRSLFGAQHPYGMSSPQSKYDLLTCDDLVDFHRQHYIAENCFAVASGWITPAEQELMEAFLAKIPTGALPAAPDFPAVVSTPECYIERPDAVQSALRVGKVLFPRNHPDFIGMQVLTTLLGGYFGSRLVSNLREDKGYTYGIYATMINLQDSGYLAIATEVGAEVTDLALEQIFVEIERLRTEQVDEAELQTVKQIMVGETMRILDGPFGIADVTIENLQNGTDNDYLNRFLAEIAAVTPQRLQALAENYLQADDFVRVVVGCYGASRHTETE